MFERKQHFLTYSFSMSRLKNRHIELIQLLRQNADNQTDTKADLLNETNFTVIIFLKIS